MRIPPYYRQTGWQRFLAGMAIGGFISWTIFLYIFGSWQEIQSKEIQRQKDEIVDLKKAVKIWQEDFNKLNEKNQEQLTVQNFKVKITNFEKYKLDLLSVSELEEGIKEDIDLVMAKDLESVYNNRDLIKKVIENKVFILNDKRYKLQVKEMIIYTTLEIQLQLILDG
ncbi:sporulation protein [Bacillus methanolicus]|uniref:sporulation membrane protein YtrI n=1 Tax=Bacillus methanolicus TaxID=1471 RepID=UPI00237FEEEF|nr:sporulation membrane protein YtrI [Bacillus methanolicus]MDE3839893.1 sporulation protein [Bacillus methanolicus]